MRSLRWLQRQRSLGGGGESGGTRDKSLDNGKYGIVDVVLVMPVLAVVLV